MFRQIKCRCVRSKVTAFLAFVIVIGLLVALTEITVVSFVSRHLGVETPTEHDVAADNLTQWMTWLYRSRTTSTERLHKRQELLFIPSWQPVNFNKSNETFSCSNGQEELNRTFVTIAGKLCYRRGVDITVSNATRCPCLPDWFGDHCSIPAAIHMSTKTWSEKKLVLRQRPRRIIQAFPFNIELDMLEVRLAELADVVDAFLILESNYTAYGDYKRMFLLEALRNGSFTADVSCKIIYIFLDFFPAPAHKDGWIADALHRNYIGQRGFQYISNWNYDDIFLLTDADEIPKREIVSFLKWHDGYSEPVSVAYSWTVFGYYWGSALPSGEIEVQKISAAVSMGFLMFVLRGQVYDIRKGMTFVTRSRILELNNYLKIGSSELPDVHPWVAGTDLYSTGWHCSWCLDPYGIRTKLISAQNGDFPRWGDYPEKRDIGYIKRLIATGYWFDDKTKLRPLNVATDLPSFVQSHRHRFQHLLINPYKSTLTSPTAQLDQNDVTKTISNSAVNHTTSLTA